MRIHLKSVEKRYGPAAGDAAPAVHRTDLDFEPGRTTALIGPSGCGKSTLLRLILGLIAPSGGVVELDGQPLTPQMLQSIRRRVGYVIQDGGLFPHLTASGNATLMARQIGTPAAEIATRLGELCELTRFPQSALDRFPAELSGGQRQRVALMRALMLRPEALLLDEPLGALDPMVRAGLQTDLKRIFGELQQTVILVTHDMGEAGYLADRIVLMRAGRILQSGTLEDLRDRPADPYVSEFLNAQRSLVAL
jgi:osmoprotectant transport system ATP-binding protein